MSNHSLRHILGFAFSRDTGRHGILVNGVNYHSKRLAEHFQRFGKQHVDVRIDPEDMGHISVWFENSKDGGWSTLKAQIDGLEGVSFSAWERSIFELRQSNRNAASLTQGVVDRAIKRVKEIDAEQCALRQLGPIGDTYDQIKRAQKETFWGLSLGGDPELYDASSGEDVRPPDGFLSNEITHDPTLPPSDRPAVQDDQHHPTEFWSFSDKEDDQTRDESEGENND